MVKAKTSHPLKQHQDLPKPKYKYRERCVQGLYSACLDEQKRFKKKRISVAAVRAEIRKAAVENEDKLGPQAAKYITKQLAVLADQGIIESPSPRVIQFTPKAVKTLPKLLESESPNPRALTRLLDQDGMNKGRASSVGAHGSPVRRTSRAPAKELQQQRQIEELVAEKKMLEERMNLVVIERDMFRMRLAESPRPSHGPNAGDQGTDVDMDETHDEGGLADQDMAENQDGFGSDDEDAEDIGAHTPTTRPSSPFQSQPLQTSSPVRPTLSRRESGRAGYSASSGMFTAVAPSVNAASGRLGLRPQVSFTSHVSHHPTPDPSIGQQTPPTFDQDNFLTPEEQALEADLTRARADLAHQTEEVKKWKDMVTSLTQQVNTEQNAKDGAIARLREESENLRGMTELLKQAEADKALLHTEVRTAHQATEDRSATILELQNQVASLNGKITEAEETITGLEETRERLMAEVDRGRRTLEEQELRIASLGNELSAVRGENEALQIQLMEASGTNADLQGQFSAASARVADLEGVVSQGTSEIGQLQLRLQEQHAAILQEREQVTAQLSLLSDKIAEKDAAIATEKQATGQLKIEVARVGERLLETTQAYEESQDENADLRDTVDQYVRKEEALKELMKDSPARDSPRRTSRSARDSLARSVAQKSLLA